jgi:hypothetical protein
VDIVAVPDMMINDDVGVQESLEEPLTKYKEQDNLWFQQ